MVNVLAVGDFTVDQVMGRLGELPAWGTEVEVDSLEIRLGGNSGNFAVSAASLGLEVTAVGPLGDDANGGWVRAQLEQVGVDTASISTFSEPTSITVALVRGDGERSFITYPGALARLGEVVSDITSSKVDVALFSGWCQPPRIEPAILVEAFSRLRDNGTVVAIDLAWSHKSWADIKQLKAVLREADIVFMNNDEACAVTGITNVHLAAVELGHQLGRKTVIVKCGSAGAVGYEPGTGLVEIGALRIADPVSAVGAGDAFNAGFLHALFEQKLAFPDAVRFACDLASWQLENGRALQVATATITAYAASRARRQIAERINDGQT